MIEYNMLLYNYNLNITKKCKYNIIYTIYKC